MQPSPYTPGEVAREVPGRNEQLAQTDERLSYLVDLQRLVGRIRVDIAPRGLGKTSLLREVQRRAEARRVLTVWVTAGESKGLIASMADDLDRATRTWRSESRRRLSERLERLTVTVGVPGARLQTEWAPNRNRVYGVREFEDVVRDTVAAGAKEKHTGLALFIDEIQEADRDGLRTLAYAWQHLQSEGQDVPAAVFAAGLPNSPDTITSVVTFSERFAYRKLDRLTDDAALVALAGPASTLGVTWTDDALDRAVTQAEGYPYLLQLIGDATWAAGGHPDRGAVLTVEHVAAAQDSVREDLEAMCRARWQKCTPSEQKVVRAMAALGDAPVRRAAIAAELGVTTQDLSVARAKLLDKGIIETAGHGVLMFTIPGFAQYVRERES